MTAEYIIEVYNLNSTTGVWTRIGELNTTFGLEFNKLKNKVASASFSISTYSPEGNLLQPFKSWILIKRDGSPEFLGNIVDVRGNSGPDDGTINVTCNDILYSLNQIYYEGRYIAQNTEASTIATALIAYAQAKTNGNFGIQSGTIQTVGNTNETLYYQSIGKALTNQADNIVGYIFTFIPILDVNGELDYVQFNLYSSLGTVRNNLPPLELGYSVNIVDFAMGGEVYNNVFSLGDATGDVEAVESADTYSQEYFSLREIVNKESGISVKSTLQEKGDSFLSVSKGVRLELRFTLTQGISPYYGEFGLMDVLGVKISIGNTFYNFNGTAQVTEISFRYDNARNQEFISPVIEYYKT